MSDGIPVLLDLRQVAECCHVSPHTVRKWVRQGKLRPLRLCRRLLFHPDEIGQLLKRTQGLDAHVEPETEPSEAIGLSRL